MANLTFQEKLISEQGHLIHLVTGEDDTGRRAWYFLFVKKEKKSAFEKSLKSGNLNLSDYGKILESGYGDQPPEAVTQRIKEKYKVDT